MTALQDPRVTAQFEAVTSEFTAPIQAAGLPTTALNPSWYDTPLDYRRAMVTKLQKTLPQNTPASIRGTLSPQATADMVGTTAERVKTAVMQAASAGPTLRAMVRQDATGREITEFVGAKKMWMQQYTAPAMLMKRIGDAKY
ncbi:hypothetical protein [Paraburkholderia caffeinilytica]|uniref:hypothetical protein n=1 Tax=Paraburkholderia caffeinilytica TaxID=1761016 RepID=UPI0038B753CD